jgi:hypothetical protein
VGLGGERRVRATGVAAAENGADHELQIIEAAAL